MPEGVAMPLNLMNQLNPEVKIWGDKIYQVDRQKFQKLIIWLRAAENTYSTEVIVATLKEFEPYALKVDASWWPYLDKLLDKNEGKINARNAETESARHKEETRELADMFGGNWLGKKSN